MNGYLQNGDYTTGAMEGDNKQQMTDPMMMMMGQEGMGGGVIGGQSLDEIVNQNAKAMRRQSMPQQYGGQQDHTDTDMRRVSMMEYSGTPSAGPMSNFQYDLNAGVGQGGMMSGSVTPAHSQQHQNLNRHQSNADLSLQTSFPEAARNFNPIMQPSSAYQSPAHPPTGYDMSMSSPYVDHSMGMQMDYNVDQGLGNSTPANPQMNMYSQPQQFGQGMMQQSPMHYGGSQTPLSARPPPQDSGGGNRTNSYPAPGSNTGNAAQTTSRRQSIQRSAQTSPVHAGASSTPGGQAQPAGPQKQQMQGFSGSMEPSAPAPSHSKDFGNPPQHRFDGLNGPVPINPANFNPNNQSFDWEPPEGGWPSTMTGRPHMQTTYKNAYSSTGFDMLGVLVRVACCPPNVSIIR